MQLAFDYSQNTNSKVKSVDSGRKLQNSTVDRYMERGANDMAKHKETAVATGQDEAEAFLGARVGFAIVAVLSACVIIWLALYVLCPGSLAWISTL